jgi:uncharacterized protein
MLVFLDSSAFAKRYLAENGTGLVLDWCNKADALAVSSITVPEIVSALNRLVRDGRLTKGQYLKAKDDLILDLVDVAICDLDAQVTSKAIRCLEQSVLRGMDAIQIACALTLLADCFLTADKRQHEAALFAGLNSVLVE